MPEFRRSPVVGVVALVASGVVAACSTTWVVVPAPGTGYTAMDTLYGERNGEEEVRVVFRFDTIVGVDTVVRLDTILVVRFDTVVLAPVSGGPTGADRPGAPVRPGGAAPPPNPGFQPAPGSRVDTVRISVPQLRVDTVRLTQTITRVDTVRITVPPARVDTVRITETTPRVDTVRVVETVARVDTVRVTETIVRVDTVRVTETLVRVDTVRVTETVRSPGRRVLFVPPGQHPPAGQCRIWVYDFPPGQQAPSVPCPEIGAVAPGAFVLFAGEAWDFDYDWIAEGEARPGTVPPEVLAVQRRRGAPG